MNKFITKVAKLVLGLSLAAGVGVAVGSQKASRADAAPNGTYTLTISYSDFTTTSYANNNGSHTKSASKDSGSGDSTMSVAYTSYQAMQSSNKIQFQKKAGYIYNTTDLGTINSVTLSSGSSGLQYTIGSSENPSSSASGGYFKVYADTTNSAQSCTQITISYTISTSKENVELSCDDLDLDVSDSATALSVSASSGGNTVTGLTYTYDTADHGVATVNNSGQVTPVDIGTTSLTISFAGNDSYNSASTTITVNVSDATLTTSNLTFAAACGGTGTASDDAVWAVSSDGTESVFSADDGIHYGTNSASVQYIQMDTSDIKGVVKRIIVTARDANAVATVSVTVGSTPYSCTGSTTATNSSAAYTFTGNTKGAITVKIDRGSAQTKALYIKSVVVYYQQITLQSISLSGTYPTTFDQGDEFSHAGMVVTANYSDNSTENVTTDPGTTWTGYDMQTAGNQTVTVTYKTKTATYSISVTAAVMYSVGGTILNGSLSSTDSVRENNSLNITINANAKYLRPESLSVTMGGNTLTIGSGYTYNSSTGAFNIASVTGNVVINGECTKEHGLWDDDPYSVSEAWTIIDGYADNGKSSSVVYVTGVVTGTPNDGQYGSTFNITDGTNTIEAYSISGAQSSNSANAGYVNDGYTVVVGGALIKFYKNSEYTYEVGYASGFSSSLVSSVPPKTVSSIVVKTAPTKTAYKSGESFDPTGLVITATYSDNSISDVEYLGNEASFSFSPSTITEAGNVTITYRGQTCTQAVTVVTVTNVTGVASAPLEVNQNSSINVADVTLNVVYSDSSVGTVNPDSITCDTSSLGSAQATATYNAATGTKTATFNVTVVAAPGVIDFGNTSGYFNPTSNSDSYTDTLGNSVSISTDGAYSTVAAHSKQIGTGNNSATYVNITITLASRAGVDSVTVVYKSAGSNKNVVLTAYGDSVDDAILSGSVNSNTAMVTATTTNSYEKVNANAIHVNFAPTTGVVIESISYTLGSLVQEFGILASVVVDSSSLHETEFKVGQTFSSEGLVLLATDTNGFTKLFTSGFTTTYDGVTFNSELSDEENTVTLTVGVNTATCSYTFNVINPPTYSAITSQSDLYEGMRVLIYGQAGYAASVQSGTYMTESEVTLTGNDITDAGSAIEFVVRIYGTSGFALQHGTSYLHFSGNSNTADMSNTLNEESVWTFDENGLVNVGDDSREFRHNHGATRFACYTNTTGTRVSLYVSSATPKTDIMGAETYAYKYLHLRDYLAADANGSCSTYYGTAKTQFSSLTAEEKTEFIKLNDAVARLQAWANANGETFDPSTKTFSARSSTSPLAFGSTQNTNTIAIIVIISMVSVTAIGGYFFLKRREQN